MVPGTGSRRNGGRGPGGPGGRTSGCITTSSGWAQTDRPRTTGPRRPALLALPRRAYLLMMITFLTFRFDSTPNSHINVFSISLKWGLSRPDSHYYGFRR